MERVPNQAETDAYNRVEVVERSMSQARELLAERLEEGSTSLERSATIMELLKEMGTPPLDNSKRHVVESLSIMLGLEELIQPLEEYKAAYPELEAA